MLCILFIRGKKPLTFAAMDGNRALDEQWTCAMQNQNMYSNCASHDLVLGLLFNFFSALVF